MGVYIPNMEMPKNCTFCEMWHNIDCHPYQGISPPKSRPDHCPLISVPPHGRLIDAKEQIMRIMQSGDYDTYDDYNRTFDMLDNAPTIIPADGG